MPTEKPDMTGQFSVPPSTFAISVPQRTVGPTIFFVNGYPPQSTYIQELIEFGRQLAKIFGRSITGSFSIRYGQCFLVTAERVALDQLGMNDIIEIVDYDPVRNTLLCIGKKHPAAEAIIHWFTYRGFEEDDAIILIHGDFEHYTGPEDQKQSVPITTEKYEFMIPELAMKALYPLRDSGAVVLKARGLIVRGENLESCRRKLEAIWGRIKTTEELAEPGDD